MSIRDRVARAHLRTGRAGAMSLVVLLVLVGCGDGGEDDPTPILSAPTTTPVVPSSASPQPATPAPVTTAASPSPTGPTAPSVPAVPTPGATLPANQGFTSGAAEIGPIVWATAIDPVTFAPTVPVVEVDSLAPAIYAVVPVRRIEPGTTVSATWAYNDTPIPTTSPAVTVIERREGVWLAFDLSRGTAEPWPDGTLAVTIAIDGQPVSGAEILIIRAAG